MSGIFASKNFKGLALRTASTLIILRIAARQDLYLLRNLPTILFAIPLIQHLTLPYYRNHSSRRSTPTVLLLSPHLPLEFGIVQGLHSSLFFWSLLKLPPGAAVALHLLSEPISRLIPTQTNSHAFESSPLRVWITLMALLFVPLGVLPFDFHSFVSSIISTALGCLMHLLDQATSPTPFSSQSPSPEPLRSIASVTMTLVLSLFTTVYGGQIYFLEGSVLKLALVVPMYGAIYALYYFYDLPPAPSSPATPTDTAAVSLGLLLSALGPTTGARISLYDIVVFAVILVMAIPAAFKLDSGKLSPGVYS